MTPAQDHQQLLDAEWYPLEHVEHDLQIRQRLRQ